MAKRGCLCMLPCTSSLDFFFRELKADYQLEHLMKLQFLLTEYGITFKRFVTWAKPASIAQLEIFVRSIVSSWRNLEKLTPMIPSC